MKKFSELLLVLILIVLASSLLVSVFGNIAYPLLWNDEAETVMFAERIINYGYPKVHDGKNVLNLLDHPQPSLGVKKEIDAIITSGWGQYYAAVPGVLAANLVGNLYFKTVLVRIPFVIYGLVGLIFLFLAITPLLYSKPKTLLWCLNIFLLFELFSVIFTLHVREVRSYSLILMLVGILLFVYLRYHIFNLLSYRYYFFWMLFLLWLIFMTFYPLYFILVAVFSLHLVREIVKIKEKMFKNQEMVELKKRLNSRVSWMLVKEIIKVLEIKVAEIFNKKIFLKPDIKKYFYLVAPVWLSLILVIPCAIFLETFMAAKAVSGVYGTGFQFCLGNLKNLFFIFGHYELLYLLIFLRLVALFLSWYKNNNPEEQNNYLFLKVNNFFSLLVVVYFLIFASSPLTFTRYSLFVQPILTLIIILDLKVIYSSFLWERKFKQNRFLIIISVLLLLFFSYHCFSVKSFIRGHFYELSHQYQGPLDFAIPFIQSQFSDTENIVIATNYEEHAYMYYLGSKVIVGFVGNNLEEDKKIQPDVIIFRKEQGRYREVFDNFLQKAKYTAYYLPVYDYRFNNIPEPSWHLYQTILPEKDKMKLTVFIKE